MQLRLRQTDPRPSGQSGLGGDAGWVESVKHTFTPIEGPSSETWRSGRGDGYRIVCCFVRRASGATVGRLGVLGARKSNVSAEMLHGAVRSGDDDQYVREACCVPLGIAILRMWSPACALKNWCDANSLERRLSVIVTVVLMLSSSSTASSLPPSSLRTTFAATSCESGNCRSLSSFAWSVVGVDVVVVVAVDVEVEATPKTAVVPIESFGSSGGRSPPVRYMPPSTGETMRPCPASR